MPTFADILPTRPFVSLAVQPTPLELLSPFIGVLAVAFLISVVATPLMRKLAVDHGVVDVPDLKRKNHAVPVAYLGGVAIFLGWLVGVTSAMLLDLPGFGGGEGGYGRIDFPLAIVFGATAITLTGMFDDVYGIRARVKIGGQLFAAAALASENVGVRLTVNALDVSKVPWRELNEFAVPLLGGPLGDAVVYAFGTFLIAAFVIGACNAVNLIDGLDGLASGVVAIATVGFLLVTLIVASRAADPATLMPAFLSDPIRVVMCLAIIGAILGFLPYNFNPASIFMGDAGSLLLGFLAAATILLFSDTGGFALKIVTAMLIIFAVPITDTSLAIIRRKMRGYPITAPDNQHIHHLLRRCGLSVKQAVLVMYGAGVVFATLGVTMVALDWAWRYILVVFVLLYGTIMALSFKYGAYQLALEKRQREQLAEQARLAADAPIDQPVNATAAAAVEPDANDDSAAGLASSGNAGGTSRLGLESPN
ncbi:MAG: MraY family glycosyltransferase [Planctomycetota bacterium]